MTTIPTPRDRVQAFLESINNGSKYAAVVNPRHPLLTDDLRAVLKANAQYEDLMREAGKEAVREYKAGLIENLRGSWDYVYGTSIADDLEDGTL